VNRGVAIYRDASTSACSTDAWSPSTHRPAHVVWSVQTTPVGSDYSITGAPRVVKGKVLIGNGGGEYGVRGYLTAYDAESGKQAWRWYVVPGDPSLGLEDGSMERAVKTWRGEWWKYGGGGTPWDGIAYDPEADLVYVGTGNGSPWSRDHRSQGSATTFTCPPSSRCAPRPASTCGTTRRRPGTTGTTTRRSR
jgi:quinohemoprotein ethanol dehydrogenase